MKISNVYDFYDHYVGSYLKDRTKIDRSKYEVHVVNFLVELHKRVGLQHVGYEWFNQYMVYQLDYWKDKDVKYATNMSFVKIIGKASLIRFLNRSKDFNWFMAKKGLSVRKLNSNNEYEKIDRRGLYQSMSGCLVNHLKFNDSHVCRLCLDSEICKKL